MPIERVLTQSLPDEEQFHSSLRPRRLAECIGQEQVKEQLAIAIGAAKKRREPLDHMLLDGPPGLGKTTFANVIANEMGAELRTTSGPAITRQGDLMALLTQLDTGDILFIDEIHRLNAVVEEFLYPAIEDFRVDYTTESGLGGRTINFQLKRFTLIGATTRSGMLSAPLRGRLGQAFHFQWYNPEELTRIVTRTATFASAPSHRNPGARYVIANAELGAASSETAAIVARTAASVRYIVTPSQRTVERAVRSKPARGKTSTRRSRSKSTATYFTRSAAPPPSRERFCRCVSG